MKLPTAGHFWLFGHLRVGTNLFFDLIAQNCINLVSVNRIFFEQICNLPEDDFEKYVKNNLDKTLVHKISNNYERLRSVIESYPHVKIFQYRRSIRDQLLSYKSSTLMRKWHWDNDADTQGLEQIKHKFIVFIPSHISRIIRYHGLPVPRTSPVSTFITTRPMK